MPNPLFFDNVASGKADDLVETYLDNIRLYIALRPKDSLVIAKYTFISSWEL